MKFFQDPDSLDRLATYATFFDGRAPRRVDSSPVYSWYPLVVDVPERIHAAVPEARLIYLVRDPVERTVSQYVQAAAAIPMAEALEDALADTDDPYNMYVALGRYATQLEQYTRFFPMERILVVDQADLLDRRQETLRRVFRFLDVDDEFISPDFAAEKNARSDKRFKTSAYRAMSRSAPTAVLRRRLPVRARQALFAPVKRLATRDMVKPALTEETRLRLREVFRPEVERLRKMTGQEFASWQI